MTTGTGAWIAAVRARESQRPDRLFDDPYAQRLAGSSGVAVMKGSERAAGSENVFIPVRVRWFDDSVLAAVAAGVRQVVLLGAGLDTRPYRLDLPPDLDWYELDRSEVLTAKGNELAGARPRCRRHPVVADVTDDWTAPLYTAGFDPGRITAWLAEGLLFYLAPESVTALLRTTAGSCAAGSLFLADVVGAAGLNAPAMRAYRDWCARTGAPPPFGLDDPAALFGTGDWCPEKIIPLGAAEANYGRLPTRPTVMQPGNTHLVLARRISSDRTSAHHGGG